MEAPSSKMHLTTEKDLNIFSRALEVGFFVGWVGFHHVVISFDYQNIRCIARQFFTHSYPLLCPFLTSGLVHPIDLDESILSFRGF